MSRIRQRQSIPDKLLPLLIGASDGLVIPFIIAIAMNAGAIPVHRIFWWGVLLACAGAIILGLISYVSSRAGHDHEHDHLLQHLELSSDEMASLHSETAQDRHSWQDIQHEAGLKTDEIVARQPFALYCGAGYLLGGLFVLLPYLFTPSAQDSRLWSVAVVLMAMLTVGAVKAKLTGQPSFKGAIRLATIGMSAAALAHYIIGLLVA